MKKLLITPLALLAITANLHAQISSSAFTRKADITTGAAGSNPVNFVFTDIDGDGKKDIVSINGSANNIGINLCNNMTPGVITATTFNAFTSTGSLTSPVDIDAGDINNDGKIDIIVTQWNETNVSIYLNQSTAGTASLSAPVNVNIGYNNLGELKVADLDGDGLADFVVFPYNASAGYAFRNTTTSASTVTFAAPVSLTTLGINPGTAVVADLNNDGKKDLALNTYNNNINKTQFFRNTSTVGTISFVNDINISVGSLPHSIAAGDFNNDGKTDIVAANYNSASLSVMENDFGTSGSTLSFKTPFSLNAFANSLPSSMVIVDINDDNHPDLISLSNNAGASAQFSVFINKGLNGTLSASSFYSKVDFDASGETTANYMTVDDIDGDHKADLLFSVGNHNRLIVFQNTLLAQEPTTASTGLSFANITSSSVELNFTAGDGEKRLIIAKEASNVIVSPEDGFTYAASSTYGTGDLLSAGEYAVFYGSGNAVTIAGLAANTTYYFKIIETNGNYGFANYLTSPVLTGNTTTALNSGVNEVSAKALHVYPNPVKEFMTIDLPEGTTTATVTITDITGKQIQVTEYQKGQPLYLGGLPHGFYMASIYNAKGRYTTKLVKE